MIEHQVMKLSATLEKALNDQLNMELSSAYAYLGMAAWFSQTPFTGFASWMQKQNDEERQHAKKFFDYLTDRGGKVVLHAVPQPKMQFASVLEVFKDSLGHEQNVSASICKIYETAQAEKDYATMAFLKWFLDEQVEEEKTVNDMIARLELIGENHNGLFHLDRMASKRVE